MGAYVLGVSEYFSEKELLSKQKFKWSEKRNTDNGEIQDLRPSRKICSLIEILECQFAEEWRHGAQTLLGWPWEEFEFESKIYKGFN